MGMPFKVGDYVIISEDIGYRYTKLGSEGIVTKVWSDDDSEVRVKFYKLTGPQYSDSEHEFTIRVDALSLIDPSIDINHKHFKVLMKVKQMNNRRKEMGYAF